MSMNLLDLAKSSLTPILLSKAGSLFGLDEGVASKALGSIFPTLLSGILNKSATPQGAESVLSMLNDNSVDANITGNLTSQLSNASGVQALGEQGGKLLGFLFGDKASGLGEQIANISGAPAESSNGIKGLLALATPALFGLLKNQVSTNHLNAQGFSQLMATQVPQLEKSLPSQVAQWLGWGSLGSFFGGIASKFSGALGTGVGAATAAAGAVGNTALDVGKKSGGMLKWLLPLLVLGALALWALKSCTGSAPHTPPPQPPKPAAQVTPPPAPPAPTAPFDATAAMTDAKSKYLEAIKALEASGKCDGPALANALSLYVVNFASGSAALPISDVTELKKAVPALKICAKSGVKLNVVGHTDNVGNPAANQKLSEARANALKTLFVGQGLPADMFTASGKGDTDPVADNSTEAGKFKNRRITFSAM